MSASPLRLTLVLNRGPNAENNEIGSDTGQRKEVQMTEWPLLRIAAKNQVHLDFCFTSFAKYVLIYQLLDHTLEDTTT